MLRRDLVSWRIQAGYDAFLAKSDSSGAVSGEEAGRNTQARLTARLLHPPTQGLGARRKAKPLAPCEETHAHPRAGPWKGKVRLGHLDLQAGPASKPDTENPRSGYAHVLCKPQSTNRRPAQHRGLSAVLAHGGRGGGGGARSTDTLHCEITASS